MSLRPVSAFPTGLPAWPLKRSSGSLPTTPEKANYAAKFTDDTIFTMYAVPESQYFREICPLTQSNMQQFMLQVGTPATALPLCWDNYWSSGTYPSGLVDPLCSKGDNPTTEEKTNNAACAVKIARKVTNTILAK